VTINGIDTGLMRPPLKGLNKDEKRALEQVIRVVKTTISEIVNEQPKAKG
jgi:4-hydroxy-tetrahydrodipicolinate synthase